MRFLRFLTYFASIEIYIDGSAKQGWGSWAYVYSKRGLWVNESSGRVRKASSNKMEFQAAIEALKVLPSNSKVVIYSDSRLLVDAMTSATCPRGLEQEVESLSSLVKNHSITWKWIKAHKGIKFNERCDELCIQARTGS